MTIKIDRVTYRETEAVQEVPYGNHQQETGDLDQGDARCKPPGKLFGPLWPGKSW